MAGPGRPGRPKKEEERSKESQVTQVSVEDFIRTRDSVVTGLATLQSAVQDLSRAYIAHTNAVLGRAPGTAIDYLALSNPFGSNGIGFNRHSSPGARSEFGERKKKKDKKPVDPNAPKRPLTPFFLYMQSARPVIAKDLGENVRPVDVANEGTRRWATMPAKQKELWKKAYLQNRAEYRERVAAYNASLKETDPVAAQLVAENGDMVLDDEDDDVLNEDVEPDLEDAIVYSPPVSPKPSKRRKSGKHSDNATPAGGSTAEETPMSPPIKKQTTVPLPGMAINEDHKEKDRDSDRKRKRKSRGDVEDEKVEDGSDHRVKPRKGESEREKRSRRKRKSETVVDEDA